jgi:hypothetical protein
MPKGKMDYSDLDQLSILMDALAGKNPSDSVVESEKRGQLALAATDVLPKVIRPPEGRKILEERGVIFGEDDDDLFVNVTLPEGWKKVLGEHPMWTQLMDENDEEVGLIFYKAAFYDRDAFLSISKKEERRIRTIAVPISIYSLTFFARKLFKRLLRLP